MDDYELFKQKIYKKIDLDLSMYKEKQMKRRIKSLASRNGYEDLVEYFEFIDKNDEKLNEFVNFLTINVSEFFRNPEQWNVVESNVLPWLAKNTNKESFKIWSAACSTGEEPYTIAMILNRFSIPFSKMNIIATDLDDEAMNKAKRGTYVENSLKNVPADLKNKFFKKEDNGRFAISDEIKKIVQFKKHNLLDDKYFDNCDLIVCRNVMIYFTDEAKALIYKQFAKSLKPSGVLFVGSTEQIINPSQYNLKPLKTFFYGREDSNTQI